MNITLRSVVASHLHMEGREFSSNTVGIPHTERHWRAEGRGAPAIWFGSNEVRTRSANFAGGGTLNGTERSNQGPRRTLNGMEHSVRGVRGSNLSSELNFSITTGTGPDQTSPTLGAMHPAVKQGVKQSPVASLPMSITGQLPCPLGKVVAIHTICPLQWYDECEITDPWFVEAAAIACNTPAANCTLEQCGVYCRHHQALRDVQPLHFTVDVNTPDDIHSWIEEWSWNPIDAASDPRRRSGLSERRQP